MDNKKSFKEELNIIVKTVKLLHSLDTSYFWILIIRAISETARYFISIIMSALIIDELIGNQSVSKFMLYVVIIVAGNFVLKLISDRLNQTIEARGRTMQHLMQCRINQKIVSLDYEYMDNPILHDLRQKILEYENMTGTTWQITHNINRTVTSLLEIITSVTISAALFIPTVISNVSPFASVINSPFMIMIIIVGIVSVIIAEIEEAKKTGLIQLDVNTKVMKSNRIGLYMQETLLGNYHNGKDLRMYDSQEMIETSLNKYINGFNKFIVGAVHRIFHSQKKSILVNSIFTGVIYIFVVLKAFIGTITIGSIMKYVGTIQKLTTGLGVLMSSFAQIRVNCSFLNNIHKLLELPDIKYHGTLPVEKRSDNEYEIEFRNVSFKYPGTETYVLKNVSLKMHIGERLAVVGMNGAGKTTFVKLLSRLYDPTDGEILLNGINIKKYDLDEYMSLYSVVFQDFKMFSFELSQNIAVSIIVDLDKVMNTIKDSGLEDRIKTLSQGINTYVGKNFDEKGVDFSGGELQKMAIARALYKNAPIVILDEPTASLDPISEFEIYSKFDTLVGNKTAIYVSHRLSSCRFCHNIIVFHEGRIIQHGSHERLLENAHGKYHELWQAQAQYYR